MRRLEYIEKQKREYSRKVIGVLPIYYPREILTSLDLLPVEIWGPPGFPAGAGAGLIQTYICPIVRNAMAFFESEMADIVDGLLFPHTCDSIQGLATLVPDWTNWSKPVFRFQHPRGADRPEAISYLRDEINSLIHSLERTFGVSMDMERLLTAIKWHEEAEALTRQLFNKRLHFRGSDVELYRLIRLGEFLRVEDHIPLLRKAVAELEDKPVSNAIPILITGYIPEPMGILDALNSAGAMVVADDYACVSRRIPIAEGEMRNVEEKGIGLSIRRYLSLPPCPTRVLNPHARISYLISLARNVGARGMVIHVVKFCEPELFEIPSIRRAFESQGIPVLFLETELETKLSSRNTTMIEAFVEMLKGV